GDHLVADMVLGRDEAGPGPGGAAVGGSAQHDGERAPGGRGGHAVEGEERAPVAPEPRRMIGPGRGIPEGRGRVPLLLAPAEAAGSDAELPAALRDGGVPDCQQVAVRALGDTRVVVVLREERSHGTGRDLHVLARTAEVRLPRIRPLLDARGHALADIALE